MDSERVVSRRPMRATLRPVLHLDCYVRRSAAGIRQPGCEGGCKGRPLPTLTRDGLIVTACKCLNACFRTLLHGESPTTSVCPSVDCELGFSRTRDRFLPGDRPCPDCPVLAKGTEVRDSA